MRPFSCGRDLTAALFQGRFMPSFYTRFHRLVFAALLLIAGPLAAQEVDLFRASVPVTAQDQKQLQAALAQALAQVVVKVGGQKQLLQSPAVQAALREPNRYVLQFGYEKAVAADGAAALRLAASFQPEAVRQLLRGNGLPIWPLPRPDLLVWLVVDDGGARTMVGGDKHADIVQQLREAAATRGVALTLPLQDLEDNLALGENELWQLQRDAVERASGRYSKDTILFGRVSRAGAEVSGRWQLLHRGDLQGFDSRAADTAQFALAGIDRAADALAAKYAVVTRNGGGGVMTLVVQDIHSYADYAQAQAYLQRMEVISQLAVIVVDGSGVAFRANVSDEAQLRQMMALDRNLRLDDTAAAQPGTVYFRWAGNP